ncbi:MAG: pyridoxamine 5'-phosphate oxidase [Gammaproteobacteria bacterium]|jgi:pyridoxamine 5'-phosphate oxidase
MDLSEVRREYIRDHLERENLADDPIDQFDAWFEQARAAGAAEVNAMVLATAGSDGQPSVRTVLLKYFDRRGFVFFTNLESSKARQISENPKVALHFYWPLMERQVIIRGEAVQVTRREALSYFVKRPRGSQLGAWVSDQSRVVSSRSMLEMKLNEMKRRFSDGKIPLPSFWGGYRVIPQEAEFWQGRENRLHDRFLFTRDGEGWSIQRLAP